MRFPISQQDLDRGKVVDPGWYDVVIKEAVDEIAKDGQSTNSVVDFEIVGGNEGKFNGCQLRSWFNEKAPGTVIPFFAALGVDIKAPGDSPDVIATKGKKLKVYVANEMYKNRMTNQVSGFRPAV